MLGVWCPGEGAGASSTAAAARLADPCCAQPALRSWLHMRALICCATARLPLNPPPTHAEDRAQIGLAKQIRVMAAFMACEAGV